MEIAKRQLAAGALGICCAKLGEAEVLAAGGIESILLTSPVVTDAGIARVMALNGRMRELIVTCDNAVIAEQLAQAARASGKPLKVYVDIDPGLGRTGIRPGDGAIALVEQIVKSQDLEFGGLQCYAGQVQHMESPNERRSRSLEALKELGGLRDALVASGIAVPVLSGGGTGTFDIDPDARVLTELQVGSYVSVSYTHLPVLSGGGTGTFDIDPDARVLTELQVGSYVFMDRQYNDVWEKPGDRAPFEVSLSVQTTVVSANRESMATTDAGLKAFATDAEAPKILSGAPDGANYFFFGDEQGGVFYPPGDAKLRPKDVLSCVVPHCDPTVNLYDCYHAVRGDILEAIWPVDARGRSA